VSPTSPYLVEDVIVNPLKLSSGHAYVPGGVGLGIEVDEQRVRRYTIER
jgi:L-alanine-DL-glutamate epimerase-like enolase superfamily enzyme